MIMTSFVFNFKVMNFKKYDEKHAYLGRKFNYKVLETHLN